MPKMPFLHDDEQDTASARKSSRLFYTVLALCLLAVGGVAAATFSEGTTAPSQDIASTTSPTARVTTSVAPAAVTQAKSTTVTTVTSATVITTATTPPSLFVLPMGNVVLTPFSEQPLFNQTLQSYESHTAVDFDGEEGQAVHALAQGNISRIEEDPLWGGCVTIDHGDGIVSIYRGVECRLSMGSIVEAGQEIGKLGAIPCETTLGPHLHLELYQGGSAVDVSRLLGDELVTRTTAAS